MSKQGIVGRVRQLARANISDIIDSAGDPDDMLGQLLRDYTANISEAEQAIAELTSNLRMISGDQAEDAAAIARWNENAAAASRRADELRAAGEAADANTFDDLARVAIERQLIAESDVQTVQHTIDAQTESAEKLTNGLSQMRVKLSEVRDQRDNLVARARTPRAQSRLPAAGASAGIMDPASEVARFGQLVGQEEARISGHGAMAGRAADAQFVRPDDLGSQAEIEERLRELKADRAMASATARAHDQAAS